MRELLLRQREQEIRLILRRIGAALQPVRAVVGVALDARVVARSRRTRRRSPRARSTSVANFRSPLQWTQGIGVRPDGVLADEIRDDRLVELRSKLTM